MNDAGNIAFGLARRAASFFSFPHKFVDELVRANPTKHRAARLPKIRAALRQFEPSCALHFPRSKSTCSLSLLFLLLIMFRLRRLRSFWLSGRDFLFRSHWHLRLGYRFLLFGLLR